MWSSLEGAILDHFRRYLALYFFVLAVLTAGVITGTLAVNVLTETQRDELAQYALTFFQSLEGGETVLPFHDIFRGSIATNLKALLFIVLLGVTVVGMPLVVVILFVRGFIIGFSVGFLIYLEGLAGVLFALLAVVPQHFLILPGFAVAGVASLSYSLALLGRPGGRRKRHQEVIIYLAKGLLCMVLLAAGSFVEGYVVPVFMRLLAPYM